MPPGVTGQRVRKLLSRKKRLGLASLGVLSLSREQVMPQLGGLSPGCKAKHKERSPCYGNNYAWCQVGVRLVRGSLPRFYKQMSNHMLYP